MNKLDNFTDKELIDELAFRMQLRNVREECNGSYCSVIGQGCKYMINGSCSTSMCPRRSQNVTQ